MKLHTIKINWNDTKAIKRAERLKVKYENKGYILFSQTLNTLIYKEQNNAN